jgi:hypothetical protein
MVIPADWRTDAAICLNADRVDTEENCLSPKASTVGPRKPSVVDEV